MSVTCVSLVLWHHPDLSHKTAADPEFSSGGGCANSKDGCEKLLFGQFFSTKMHEIEKHLDGGGEARVPGTQTLRSANARGGRFEPFYCIVVTTIFSH